MKCKACGTENPDGFRFCGNCGSSMVADEGAGPSRTMYFGDMQKPNRAKLILIKGEGLDGVSYLLNAEAHVAGRSEGEIRFPDDPLLSPRHACFFYQEGGLIVRDEGSVNGVYVRITASIPIRRGTRFLVGEQLIEFDLVDNEPSEPQEDAEGTLMYGSPRRAGYFKLVQRLRGGMTGMVFRAPEEQVTMGREGNDVNFPDDPFISGQHAMVSMTADGFSLTDLNSKNGTFVRIEEPFALRHGNYVFVGQQLFRVEIS